MSTPTAATYARDVRVTWWYTAVSIVFLHAFAVALWALVIFVDGPVGAIVLSLIAAAGSVASAVLLLVHYRREPLDGDDLRRRPVWLMLLGVVSAVLLAVAAGSVLVGVALTAQTVCLVRWSNGIRLRLAALLFAGVIVVWIVDATRLNPDGYLPAVFALPMFVAMLAPLSATSLWWWDIVRELDRARRVEGRLAAAQERLRLASDLHDLQGHHLQVIALQLELAEKMLARDPAAAVEQVRAARASVDEARRGTRELATRFRGVPLPDELANAADLLRAAGLRVDLDIDPDAADAPADVLGPVIRECTTNVLKHGGGVSASLALRRREGAWVFSIANDVGEVREGGGTGIDGIAGRVGLVGGTVDAARLGDRFVVTVRVPEGVSV